MKKLLFIIIVVSLFVGCSKKNEVVSQTKKTEVNTQAKIAEVKETKGDELDKVKESYKWATALIESEAQKNEVMVDAFELRDAEVRYLSPANIMNGWESMVKLTFRFAVKENVGSTWYDLNAVKYLNINWNSLASIDSDLVFVINKVKGKYNLIQSSINIDDINYGFKNKTWLKE